MKKLLSLILALLATTSLWAYDFQSGDLYYNITSSSTRYTVEVTYQERSFDNYSGLTTATIPETVTYSGKTYSVTSIGDEAFDHCSSLTSVTIPNSVTSIGRWAFRFCSSLTSVTIPNSVTSIGHDAFIYCSSLTSVTIPNSVTSIGSGAFFGCDSLTSVTIGNSVTTIGNGAFRSCSSLTSVTIGNSVTSIGDNAFEDCSSLTSITIPNSVTSIGREAFRSCSSLTSVTIGNSVTSIGEPAFADCSSLTSVVVESGNTKYDSRNNCNAIIETATNTLIAGCQNTIIPNSVTSIGREAFRSCVSLTSVTIPNSVTSIGELAFRDCSSLTSVTIGNSVTNIGNMAFRDCSSLTSVTIGNSVTSIGDNAFRYCSSLKSITIPNSVTSIGKMAFAECYFLSITCEAETPPTLGSNAFYRVSTVYVPCGCVEAYKAASGWEDFTNFQEPQAEHSIQVSTSNSRMGTAKVDYNTYCEGNQISATAKHGYHFMQWNDGNTENPRTLVLTQDTVLTAEFAPNQYSITTNSKDPERGTTQGDTTANYLENITISATANYGYHFSHWNDYNYDNPRQVQVTKDKTYTAEFEKNTYSISLSCNNDQGQVEGPTSAEYLDQVTISATANYGYHFVQWSDGNTDNPRTLVLTQDTSLVAYFEIIYLQPDTVTLCYGETYQWHDKTYDASGVYIDTLSSGVATLHLTILPQVEETIEEATICSGDTYTWQADGKVYAESGTYSVTLQDMNGCDNVVILHLTVNPIATTEEHITACDSYTWKGETYTQSGEYVYTTVAANDCDSIVTLHLTINKSEYVEFSMTACETYEWHGETYTESGDYEYRTTIEETTEKLYVGYDSQNDPIIGLTPPRGISRFTVDGFITEGSGSCFVGTGTPENGIVDDNGDLRIFDAGYLYYDRMSGRNSHFFDDYRNPFNIEFGNYYAKNIETGEYYFNKVNESYEYSNTENPLTLFYNDYGKIHKVQFFDNNDLLWADINAVIKGGVPMIIIDYYETDGTIYQTQKFTENLSAETKSITKQGCDHVEWLHLTVNKTKHARETITACDSYTWNGETYTQSGEYVYTTIAENGCDSIATLHLTINKSEHVEESVTACDSYEWNGITYTESGDYEHYTTTDQGCERVEILHLTINHSEREEYWETACDEYYWDHNGETYYESGDYEYYTTTDQGCERVEVLHLTILPDATTESEELALCPSELPYEWYGQWLTEAGSYTATEQYAGMECDSVIHELTVNVYVQTLPAAVTLSTVRTGEAIDVTIPTAEIQAHIAAETWYAPNAEVAWYIMENSDWAALTTDPVAAGTKQVTLKYAVETDCGNIESDNMVIDVIPTSVENTDSQSPIRNCQKVLHEDHIYILRDGKMYSIMGQEM